jgi:hypothetical protein
VVSLGVLPWDRDEVGCDDAFLKAVNPLKHLEMMTGCVW